MRFSVLTFQSGLLLRGAAISLVAGLGAGCSSDFARFAPTSSEYTGSVNQQQIIYKKASPARQKFPEDIAQANTSAPARSPAYDVANAPVGQPMYTGSVGADGTIRPSVSGVATGIKRTVLAPVTAARQAVTAPSLRSASDAMEPVAAVKSAARKKFTEVDGTVTGAVEKTKSVATPRISQPMPDVKAIAKQTAVKAKDAALGQVAANVAPVKVAKEAAREGWSTAGGTYVSIREGETVYNLAKRYGVPANAILEANGLASASALKNGQKVIIPTYIYSSSAKMSAPDANADTALAKSSRGTVTDVPTGKAPLPGDIPAHKEVAVLPTAPTIKSKQTATTETAAATSTSKADQPGIKVVSTKKKPAAAGSYSVTSGDSLYTIAKRNGTTVEALKAANGLADGKLKIGQTLKIPGAGASGAIVAAVSAAKTMPPAVDPIVTGSAVTAVKKPIVAQAPVAPKVEKAAAPSSEVIEEAEKDTAAAPGSTGISKLRWPVKGRTLTGYGQSDAGRTNDGIDISVPNGTPIKSAENGVVIYAGTGLKDFGNTVLVRHDNGLVTVYGHAGDILVKRGQTIKRGQELAKSGMSGNTKVPKLHFEVRKNSAPVNPATYLE